jgi:hypothetical protein
VPVALPQFTDDGVLPPGDYPLTLDELKESHLVTGQYTQYGQDIWDYEWRLQLVNNAEILINQLWQVGIENIFLDGSFLEDKSHPGDIDGYFECDFTYFNTRQFHKDINALDPNQVWDWSKRFPDKNSAKRQLLMWHIYKVEFYAHCHPDQSSGILDEFGHPQTFPAAFRKSRKQHLSKGIIKIVKNKN